MNELSKYKNLAVKQAQIVDLGQEGFAAKIPGFKGLLAVGATKKHALRELDSALEDWVSLALKRGIGLPALTALPKTAVKV